MSHAVTNACRSVVAPPPAKGALMCLADRSTDDGLSWPSIPDICEWTCNSRSAVIEGLKWLERNGLVTITRQTGRNNRCSINLEAIAALAPVREPDRSTKRNQCASRTSTGDEPVREPDPTRPAAAPPPVREPDYTRPGAGPEPSITTIQPSENHQSARVEVSSIAIAMEGSIGPKRPGEEDPLFVQFYEAYPRKTNRADAWKAWRALKVSPDLLERILAGLTKWKQHPRWTKDGGQYIKYPGTWLRGRLWEDEEVCGGLQARNGGAVPEWCTRAGFDSVADAHNRMCWEHNAHEFRDGRRIPAEAAI